MRWGRCTPVIQSSPPARTKNHDACRTGHALPKGELLPEAARQSLHLPLDFFLVGLIFLVAGLAAGTLGSIFLAITPHLSRLFEEHIITQERQWHSHR